MLLMALHRRQRRLGRATARPPLRAVWHPSARAYDQRTARWRATRRIARPARPEWGICSGGTDFAASGCRSSSSRTSSRTPIPLRRSRATAGRSSPSPGSTSRSPRSSCCRATSSRGRSCARSCSARSVRRSSASRAIACCGSCRSSTSSPRSSCCASASTGRSPPARQPVRHRAAVGLVARAVGVHVHAELRPRLGHAADRPGVVARRRGRVLRRDPDRRAHRLQARHAAEDPACAGDRGADVIGGLFLFSIALRRTRTTSSRS